jgi:hypothetical protein
VSVTLIRFEALIPTDSGNNTSSDQAVETFKANLASLTNYELLNVYRSSSGGYVGQFDLVFGLLTSAQAATALGYLNTLNTSLGSNVTCYTWNVTTQP